MQIFNEPHKYLMPRIVCYFDDVVGDIDYAYNEFTGELLAINEFNAEHTEIEIAPVVGLRFFGQRLPLAWHEQIFVAHVFHYKHYGIPTSNLTQARLPEKSRGPATFRKLKSEAVALARRTTLKAAV
jgi:hypothetical protein